VKRIPLIIAFLALTMTCVTVAADSEGFSVKPRAFDPFHTKLVNASWLSGIGCPTKATVRLFDSNPPYNLLPPSQYSDPACLTGDTSDQGNQGLLMAKTGPTLNDASAVADLVGVKGTLLTELGYDIRKPGSGTSLGPSGSHCGAGAPRFNVALQNGASYFIGCNSPPATTQVPGLGWIRLQWGGAGGALQGYNQATGVLENISGLAVKSIEIVFDEGQDTGPDFFGLAVLDNIDVNGTLVGRGGNGDKSDGSSGSSN